MGKRRIMIALGSAMRLIGAFLCSYLLVSCGNEGTRTIPSEVLERAHEHSSKHREEVLSSSQCGCFYCCNTFVPEAIAKWTDEVDGVGQTALCPKCGIDSVIGSSSGFPVTHKFLSSMKERWF